MQNNCSKCFAALDHDAVFCPLCSAPVSAHAVVNCPKCGKSVSAGAKFCKYCAFDLSQPLQAAVGVEDKKGFLTPAGAAFALICFFLPWVEFSYDGRSIASFSGADIARYYDEIFWLILVTVLVILVSFFYFRGQKQLTQARPIIILSSLMGLGVLIFKLINFYKGEQIAGLTISLANIGVSIQFGGVGTILGFVLALVGSAFLEPMSDPLDTGERLTDIILEHKKEKELSDLQKKMSKLSNGHLLQIVKVDYRNYRKEELEAARAELERRGLPQSSE
jgi:hypothetical protein